MCSFSSILWLIWYIIGWNFLILGSIKRFRAVGAQGKACSDYFHPYLVILIIIISSFSISSLLHSHIILYLIWEVIIIGKKNKSHANEYLIIAIHFCQYASENVSVLQKQNQVFHSSKMSQVLLEKVTYDMANSSYSDTFWNW